jgi:hypothetical protein
MKIETKIKKIRKMIESSEKGSVMLKIGSSLEDTAFECAMGEWDELNLDRSMSTPLSDYAHYSIIIQ